MPPFFRQEHLLEDKAKEKERAKTLGERIPVGKMARLCFVRHVVQTPTCGDSAPTKVRWRRSGFFAAIHGQGPEEYQIHTGSSSARSGLSGFDAELESLRSVATSNQSRSKRVEDQKEEQPRSKARRSEDDGSADVVESSPVRSKRKSAKPSNTVEPTDMHDHVIPVRSVASDIAAVECIQFSVGQQGAQAVLSMTSMRPAAFDLGTRPSHRQPVSSSEYGTPEGQSSRYACHRAACHRTCLRMMCLRVVVC